MNKRKKHRQEDFSTGQSYRYESLLKFLLKLSEEQFTGELKLNFHKGNFSKRLSVKVTKEI